MADALIGGSVISPSVLVAGARLLWKLPALLRHPAEGDARAIVRQRLDRRAERFLSLVDAAVYRRADSPYGQLLRLAGCELGDVSRLVCDEGVEGALAQLYRRGVYLTVDELKGRRQVVRGSTTLTVSPASLRNPLLDGHFTVRSSGSGGPSAGVTFDLATMRERGVNRRVFLDALGGSDWVPGYWGVPGSQSLVNLFEFAAAGAPLHRWFVQVDPAAPRLDPSYRWSASAIRLVSRLAGRPLPVAEVVPVDTPLPVARWLAAELRAGRTPYLVGFASPIVALCRAALAADLDIAGARFQVGAEPFTAARLAAIRRAGGIPTPGYGTSEASRIAYACLAPLVPDDLHLLTDLHALIQPGPAGAVAGLPADALLISSISATAPLVLLNASLGDRADLAPRGCGCPLEAVGWTTHLHTIRSFEKLTTGGMTFADQDVARVLEELLPARFGGGPADYQVLELVEEDGASRLLLVVHPDVGPLDPVALLDHFLLGLAEGSSAERVMALQWRRSGFLAVERRPPLRTATGKVLHVHRAGAS